MRRRLAFTITELLVAMALIMFIMAVLSEAFVAGLESFRQLKSVGDMDQKLRTAAIILRRDLDANWLQVGNSTNVKASSLTSVNPSSGFFTIGENAGGDSLAAVSVTAPYSITLNYLPSPPNPPNTLPPNLSLLQPNMPILVLSPPPIQPRSQWLYVSPANTFPITTPTILVNAPPNVTATEVQWDVPNGQYDSVLPSGAVGPGSSPLYPDLDGFYSPFATTYKLHFSIDTSVIPGGNPIYKPARRESSLSASAPATVAGTVGASPPTIYSPLIYNASAPTVVSNPQPQLRPPFEEPVDPVTQRANYVTQRAEVAYFLKDNGARTPGQQKLYTLYRRQLALLANTADDDAMNGTSPTSLPNQPAQFVIPVPGSPLDPVPPNRWPNSYYDFSGYPQWVSVPIPSWTYMHFNNLADVSYPERRSLTYYAFNRLPAGLLFPPGWNISDFPILGSQANGGRNEPPGVTGADILLTDVLSFSVRVLPNPLPAPSWNNGDQFLFPGSGYQDANGNRWAIYGQYDTAYASAFDAWNNQASPPPNSSKFAGIKALEILIRVWDSKTSRARQITILQPM